MLFIFTEKEVSILILQMRLTLPKVSPLVMGEAMSNTKGRSNIKVVYSFPALPSYCLNEEGSQAAWEIEAIALGLIFTNTADTLKSCPTFLFW